jgi:predicted nucleotidyltransferase
MTTKTLPDFGLSVDDVKIINSILGQYPSVIEVKIFGSRAKGNFKPGSDIDLCVTIGNTRNDIYKIKADFDDSRLPFFVDIIDLATLDHPELAESINRWGIIFYQRA